MMCLICGEPAAVVNSVGDYEERTCPSCGHYRITVTALELAKTQGWRFDVALTRKWIAQHKGTGFIPTIDSHQAGRLTDV